MSRVLPGIRGVPMRAVVSRKAYGRRWMETLKCGHEHLSDDLKDYLAKFRRCHKCAWEKQQQAKEVAE